jgi:23S rRNA (guanosine2251-2'-O)-methyltransferase
MKDKYSENQEVDLALTYDEWKNRPQYQPKWPIDILCDRMQFKENAGQVIRSAANLGVFRIYFYQSQFQWVPSKIDKLSRSNATNIEIVQASQFSDIPFDKYSEVIALEYTHRSQSIYDSTLNGPTLLIAGSESDGIQAELLARADRALHIPLVGKQSSINVAHALTAALTYINHYRLSAEK